MLEEPVYVIEEPKEYNAKPCEEIFLQIASKNTSLRLIVVASFVSNINRFCLWQPHLGRILEADSEHYPHGCDLLAR